MNRDQFYLVLPSDSSLELYPENTTSRFLAHLPRQISLTGDWSVALSEITYPQTFQHIPNTARERIIEIAHKRTYHNVLLPDRPWHSVKDIVDFLNDDETFKQYFTIQLDENDFLTLIMVGANQKPCTEGGECKNEVDDKYRLFLSKTLSKIFGFPQSRFIEVSFSGNTSVKAQLPATLYRTIPNNLYVYTDLCEAYPVGTVETPLLRIIHVDVHNYVYERSKTVSFGNPRYIPLLQTAFQTIEIHIKTNLGESPSFSHGALTVTLHFKRNHV